MHNWKFLHWIDNCAIEVIIIITIIIIIIIIIIYKHINLDSSIELMTKDKLATLKKSEAEFWVLSLLQSKGDYIRQIVLGLTNWWRAYWLSW